MRQLLIIVLLMIICVTKGPTYPLDGYGQTNIRRLDYLEMVVDGELKGTMPVPGAMRKSYEIQLTLTDERGDILAEIPPPDPG